MKNYNKEEFDNVTICKYCNHKFLMKIIMDRKITLIEKIDEYKLKRIIDDYDQ